MTEFNAMVVHSGMRRLGVMSVKDFSGTCHHVRSPKHLVEIAQDGDIVTGIIDDGVVVLTSVEDPQGQQRPYNLPTKEQLCASFPLTQSV